MKTALFVDFDNIYSGLRQIDEVSADRFARHPMKWMNWVVNSLELPEHATKGARRRVLVRRCYLNPQAYQRFRPFFNLAGFEIIDCPALTTGGKTSTDIHMVLDIIDLLQHEAHYDEFVVFSADADFTPVLRKLRRWDRRTTVLAIGFPSAAYRASADLVIDQDEFVRGALGMQELDEAGTEEVSPVSAPAIVAATLRVVQAAVEKSATPVALSQLAGEVLAKVEGIDASTWVGYGSFLALLQANSSSALRMSEHGGGTIYDPLRHAEPENPEANLPLTSDVLESVAELIKRELKGSQETVPCAKIASTISRNFTAIAADWNGKGTFRKFLDALELGPLVVDWKSAGGHIYDPVRHVSVVGAGGSEDGPLNDDWRNDLQGMAIVKQIHEVTGVPLISKQRYHILFKEVAADVNAKGFDFVESGKRIRNRCRDAGHPISRADITFVLRGLLLRAEKLEGNNNASEELCRKFADHVRSLCLREQIILDIPTEAVIRRWIEGGR